MSETKKITLTIKERLESLKLFNEFKGNIEVMALVLDDVKAFAVKPEEWEAANLKKTPSDEDMSHLSKDERAMTNQVWQWDEKAEKEIDLHQESADYLISKIKAKSEAGDITLEDAALISLQSKLK